MEISYWLSRWQRDNTGWHMDQVYPNLEKYGDRLKPGEGTTILVPLCGKTHDLVWLAERGARVIGVEVSERAARQFFRENELKYSTRRNGPFTIYSSGRINYYCGDFFKIDRVELPQVDAIYDKAAIIALPKDQRKRYAQTINYTFPGLQRMLINTFEYEQDEMNGPPFAVFEDELQQYYGEEFKISLLHEEPMLDQLQQFGRRGLHSYLRERLYLLER